MISFSNWPLALIVSILLLAQWHELPHHVD